MSFIKKKEIKERKIGNFLYTPLQVTEAFNKIGETYDKKRASLFSAIVLLVAIILSFMFELNLVLILLVCGAYIICVPKLIFNQRKYSYEKRRFHDINSYMSQMTESFTYTNDVILSLQETASCFTSGRMNETLMEALEIIENGKADVRKAERDALLHVEEKYGCEKLKNLHSFFLSVEEHGGVYGKEFVILESAREIWKTAVENASQKMFWERNVGTGLYGGLLLVCIFMLNILRSANLDIKNSLFIQVINAILIIGFIVYYVFMDNRLCVSLLKPATVMSKERAYANFKYLQTYNSAIERGRYASIAIASLVVAVLLIIANPSLGTVAIGLCFIFVGFNIHKFIHVRTLRIMKAEIKRAFPKWLFDMMLLLQRETVEGAIEKSIASASPVLCGELMRIVNMLKETPHNPDAYMSFFKDYNIQEIDEVMRKFYSMAVGANRNKDVMDNLIETHMGNLANAEKRSLEIKSSVVSHTWIPLICVCGGMLLYFAMAVIISIGGIIDMIEMV